MAEDRPPSRRPRRIPVAKPWFDQEEERRIVEVLRSGWVTQGQQVVELEHRVAEIVGSAHAVAVSSGTAALFLSLRVLGIGPGDEVIVPSLTFIATVNAIAQAGATPVFADVDPRTYNLDPDAVEVAVGPRTRAILPVHQLGLPADLDRLSDIARRRGLHVVEDAACALGALHRGRPIGGSGNLVAFSFHPRKLVVTGEGGMIATADADTAARLRRLRHQGMSVSDLERHRAERVINETYPEIGWNFRLSDLHAAVGLAQLDKLERMLAQRRAAAARYDRAFAGTSVETPFVPDFAVPNRQAYIVRLRGFDEGSRNRVLDEMLRRGVATRRGLMAVHREPPYRKARIAGPLRHTDAAADQTMILPMYAGLSDDDVDYVIEALLASVEVAGPRLAPAGEPDRPASTG